MTLIQKVDGFKPLNNAALLQKAEQLRPELILSRKDGKQVFPVQSENPALGKGDVILFDFGTHVTGRLHFSLSYTGSHPDAPVYVKLQFAEIMKEFDEDPEEYDGWISRSWIQQEEIHIDVIPGEQILSRRYSFRYLKMTILDTSPKFKVSFHDVYVMSETSACEDTCIHFQEEDEQLEQIRKASLKTLSECMQSVFEDGPKRDRRLWMGDLYLQAKVNQISYRNMDLVKRCLYLFAGTRFPDGRIAACVFHEPEPEADDTWLFDYSLFFVSALEDYLKETDDEEALNDLYETAMAQIDISASMLDENHMLMENAVQNTFIDWSDDLNKKACAQAVMIYVLSDAIQLACRRNDADRVQKLISLQTEMKQAAREQFFDSEKKMFHSDGQYSAAVQIWMTLSETAEQKEAEYMLEKIPELNQNIRMNTPYMHSYYLMALCKLQKYEEAIAHIRSYWASMLAYGGDTFFEAWDPENPDVSPYGGMIVNSFCHAWSCTPAWIMAMIQRAEVEVRR